MLHIGIPNLINEYVFFYCFANIIIIIINLIKNRVENKNKNGDHE